MYLVVCISHVLGCEDKSLKRSHGCTMQAQKPKTPQVITAFAFEAL